MEGFYRVHDWTRDHANFFRSLKMEKTVMFVLLSLFWHAQLGLQVVVEDYVHGWAEWFLQLSIRFLCVLGAIASVLSVCRIVFAA